MRVEIINDNYIIRRTKDDNFFQIINISTDKYGFITPQGDLLTSCIYDQVANYCFNSTQWLQWEWEYIEEQWPNSEIEDQKSLLSVFSAKNFEDLKGKFFNCTTKDEALLHDDLHLQKLTLNTWTASEGFGIICIGGKFGYIDKKGVVVVPLIYDFATPFVNGKAFVKKDSNKWEKLEASDLK